jgi:hypothetical protein
MFFIKILTIKVRFILHMTFIIKSLMTYKNHISKELVYKKLKHIKNLC